MSMTTSENFPSESLPIVMTIFKVNRFDVNKQFLVVYDDKLLRNIEFSSHYRFKKLVNV